MKLIIGLGNPGDAYHGTRHNLGWAAVERLALAADAPFRTDRALEARTAKARLGAETAVFALPTTYMNLSGRAAAKVLSFYHLAPADLLVVQDELDLPLGTLKFAHGSGAAGHNGIRSLIEALGTRDFARLRLGVGRPATPQPVDAYVLERFGPDERAAAERMAEESGKAIVSWITDGLDAARQAWNGKKA